MYGITETTIHATYRPIGLQDIEKATGRATLALPLPDLQVYVLDEWMQPYHGDSTGELCVGGAGVARGYLDRADPSTSVSCPIPTHGKRENGFIAAATREAGDGMEAWITTGD